MEGYLCVVMTGEVYTIGYVSDKCFKDINYDKYSVQKSIKKEEKAFKDMMRAVMPPQLNLLSLKLNL